MYIDKVNTYKTKNSKLVSFTALMSTSLATKFVGTEVITMAAF